ncbi:hypothetical protein [Nocardioides sp. CER19]|nr:hypothetical protein [Nocardioides sp. CER19]MDH2416019.1 hypothetical protein [Nocardioides sp. CER19]
MVASASSRPHTLSEYALLMETAPQLRRAGVGAEGVDAEER